mmetsp:Transcript_44431/g.89739  ORF Transcript_44431/g.89739 Transcript_44431/m.89739 type:complete len:371 (+) Transcript_44431:201-1313(+)
MAGSLTRRKTLSYPKKILNIVILKRRNLERTRSRWRPGTQKWLGEREAGELEVSRACFERIESGDGSRCEKLFDPLSSAPAHIRELLFAARHLFPRSNKKVARAKGLENLVARCPFELVSSLKLVPGKLLETHGERAVSLHGAVHGHVVLGGAVLLLQRVQAQTQVHKPVRERPQPHAFPLHLNENGADGRTSDGVVSGDLDSVGTSLGDELVGHTFHCNQRTLHHLRRVRLVFWFWGRLRLLRFNVRLLLFVAAVFGLALLGGRFLLWSRHNDAGVPEVSDHVCHSFSVLWIEFSETRQLVGTFQLLRRLPHPTHHLEERLGRKPMAHRLFLVKRTRGNFSKAYRALGDFFFASFACRATALRILDLRD